MYHVLILLKVSLIQSKYLIGFTDPEIFKILYYEIHVIFNFVKCIT